MADNREKIERLDSLSPAKAHSNYVFREILHSYEEFKARVDASNPIHHRAFIEILGDGVFSRLTFRIYGLDKKGQMIIFEVRKLALDFYEQRREYERLVEKYAKPLGSTEGAWIT